MMSIEKVRAYFRSLGWEDKVMEFEHSSATVEEAAVAVGTTPGQIAKTLSFIQKEGPVLILAAGDKRVDNKKYKALFSQKAKMIPWDDVEQIIGYAPGGVCPFSINDGIRVFLDESLKEYDIVYPAAGSGNSAVKLTIAELEESLTEYTWVDVCS